MQNGIYHQGNSHNLTPAPKAHKSRRLVVLALFIAFLAGIAFLSRGTRVVTSSGVVSKSSSKPAVQVPPIPDLTTPLAAIFAQYTDITVGVAMIDLDNHQAKNYGSTAPFVAASTAKLITAVDFLQEVEAGKHSLSQPLGGYTAGWQLEQMINQSNNDSWHLLNNLLGYRQLQDYAHQIGLTTYDSIANTVTVSDEAKIVEAIYEHTVINQADASLVLGYMQNTNNELLIPAALPADATVHHKYGWIDSNLHDASVINYHGHNFVLVIYTTGDDVSDYDQQVDLIHKITTAVITAEQ